MATNEIYPVGVRYMPTTRKGVSVMPGTKSGGAKAAATNKRIHGSDFYARIGRKGGKNGHTGGFAANPELARIAGAKGGKISRRGPSKIAHALKTSEKLRNTPKNTVIKRIGASMKLRNKKTGEVFDALIREKGGLGLYKHMVFDIKAYEHDGCIKAGALGEFNSLAELNEEWEDYVPKEPLIKDEKIRKAVRAWAEANGLDYANCYGSAHAWYLRAFNSREQGIDIEFWGYQLPKELTDCKTYTIEELCGEEKE